MPTIPEPGVEISQEFRAAAAPPIISTLAPAIIAPCFQLIPLFDASGALNADARVTSSVYRQASMLIDQDNLPDPRDNIEEVVVDWSALRAALSFGPTARRLTNSAFLASANYAASAAILASEPGPYTFSSASALVVGFDLANSLDETSDVSVPLEGSYTAAEVATAVNNAAGKTVAAAWIDEEDLLGNGPGEEYLLIRSTAFGAKSSVTLRPGSTALPVLFGAGVDVSLTRRVDGAGFRGHEDGSGSLVSSWIEFQRGQFYEDGVVAPFVDPASSTDEVIPVLVTLDGPVFSRAAAVTFTGSGATVPLRAATSSRPGDLFIHDGVGDGVEVIRVEETRFALGELDLRNSTTDASGEVTGRVYAPMRVATRISRNPFSPKFAYFIAQGLSGDVSGSLAAEVVGVNSGLPASPAWVAGDADVVFPADLGGLTLHFSVATASQDGDTLEYVFSGPGFSSIGDLVSALSSDPTFEDLIISSSGDRLVLRTVETGEDVTLTIFATGTANAALGLSATVASGVDAEFASPAELLTPRLTLDSSLTDASSVVLMLSSSSPTGDYTVSSSVDLSGIDTLADLAAAIASAFGGDASDTTVYYGSGGASAGGVPLFTVEVMGNPTDTVGQVALRSVVGGAEVSASILADNGSAGRFLGFYEDGEPAVAEAATAYSGGLTAGDDIEIDVTVGSTTETIDTTVTAPMAAAATADELASLLNSNPDTNGIAVAGTRLVFWYTTTAGEMGIRSVASDATLAAASPTSGLDNMGFTTPFGETGSPLGGNSEAVGIDLLKAAELDFRLDGNPHVYSVIFGSNSLPKSADSINEEVGGAEDVALVVGTSLTLTSLLIGAASEVEVLPSTAATVLGLTPGAYLGSGRPEPDFYVSSMGARVGPNILRNNLTGAPFSVSSVSAPLFIGYKGLRLDVTPAAADPRMIAFSSVDDMEAAIGPISPENPLALAAFLAMGAAPGVSVPVLGVDEVSATEPEGTIAAWARALEFLESKEVYCLAAMTQSPFVHGLIDAHVREMSLPTSRDERVTFLWTPNPIRRPDGLAASGAEGNSGGSVDTFICDENPGSGLVALGVDISDVIPVSAGAFLEVVVGTSGGGLSLRRYSIAEVTGNSLILRSAFSQGENEDGFFTTIPLSETLTAVSWSVKVRGAPLVLPGTSRLDLNAVAEAMSTPFQSRRVCHLALDSWDTTIDGQTVNLPGYYIAAIISGMVASLPPQQPFSNVTIPFVEKVYGTDDTFSFRTGGQLDKIQGGGRWVIINRKRGGGATTRRQLTTDTRTVESREFSITKALDRLAKTLRSTIRVFTGSSNITPLFLDNLTMSITGACEAEVSEGTVNSADILELLQDELEPDTIVAEIEANPSYPCNTVKLTIIS